MVAMSLSLKHWIISWIFPGKMQLPSMQLPSGELDNWKDHIAVHGKESNLHISFPFRTDSILPFQNHCEYCEITCKIAPLQFAE